MVITDQFVLPKDVVLTPVINLPKTVREAIKFKETDYALTRPNVRANTKIISAETAVLLQEFRLPNTIVKAIISYSQTTNSNPQSVLSDAYSVLLEFLDDFILVSPESKEDQNIMPSFTPGNLVDGWEIIKCVQAYEDIEVYHVKNRCGLEAALKILRRKNDRKTKLKIQNEAEILKRMDGLMNPRLLKLGSYLSRAYLAMEWCEGTDAATTASALRLLPDTERNKQILGLCSAILKAYAHIHKQKVIHSDIHPRNVLITNDNSIKIIDYGRARINGKNEFRKTYEHRGGIVNFCEPEFAYASIHRFNYPKSSLLGEQYSLAALLYFLITGEHYLDFSLEHKRALIQIVEESPLSFVRRRAPRWPALEYVIFKALQKNPTDRYPSVEDFSKSLSAVSAPKLSFRYIYTQSGKVTNRSAQLFYNKTLQNLDISGKLFKSGLPDEPTCSVSFGSAGIAYALYRISCLRGDPKLLSWADAWSVKAFSDSRYKGAFYKRELNLTSEIIGKISPYHTVSGIHAVQALISHAMGDVLTQNASIEAFMRNSKLLCDNLDLTLGHAGTLLVTSILMETMPSQTSLIAFGDEVMQRIQGEIDKYAPIKECANLKYLGIAHGWSGILYAILRWCRISGARIPQTVQERLQQFAECAVPAGNGIYWKMMNQENNEEILAGSWCNGTAGIIHLWTIAYEIFNDPLYLKIAKKVAEHIWDDSSKSGILCCGIVGRAYGLLNLYKYTGKAIYVTRARKLALSAVDSLRTKILPCGSLFSGEIGIALLIADLSFPERACLPFFGQEV